MTAPLSLRMRFAARLAGPLALALLGAAVAGLSADPPAVKAPDKPARPPEEEDPDARPVTHKVHVDEPDDAAKTTTAPRAVDLAQAARDAQREPVRKLFRDIAVPHDFLKCTPSGGSYQYNIVPIPDYVADQTDALPDSFPVTPFARTSWAQEDPKTVKRVAVASITPYEALAVKAVDDFLQAHLEQKPPESKEFVPRAEQDVAAEQALTTVLLRLQSERRRGGRKGDAWQAVEDSLKQKLLGVLLERRDALAAADDWDGAFDLTKQLAMTYRAAKDQERIAAPLVVQVRRWFASLEDKQKADARKRLVQLQALFPDNPAIQPVAAELQKQAQALLDQAKEEMKAGRSSEQVSHLLTEAAEAWPGAPDLQSAWTEQIQQYPVLRVGVRELPARLWPTRAVTDSDRRAVELLFEGLMKLHRDGAGGDRWEPALAEGRPVMVPCGRQFRLPANACWSNGERITAEDVHYTAGLIRKGRFPGRPPVWGDLFDDVSSLNDQSHLKFTLAQGWLDPLAPMNFKVMPSGVDPDAPASADNPLGSGPFVYEKSVRMDGGRPCVTFLANARYRGRPGHKDLPRIEQIRFIAYKGDPADERSSRPGRLDLMLDLTAKEADALQAKASALHVTLTGPASVNRRIYFLAVNHRKPSLANAAFRAALAYAIHRDRLLDDDFRAAPGQNLHAPLNGPYPVHSWAAADLVKTRRDPFNVELARAKKTDSGVADATLSLKYPAGDPQIEKAMTDLAAEVKEAIGVTLRPEAEAPADLRKDVEETHAYDLAYYHYDFPDDVYWLGPLLDPRAGPNGENYLGYAGGLAALVQDASRRRDFPQVRDWTHELHKKFLDEEMPFIPLWQLDPLAAVGDEVSIPSSDPPFDPVLVFTDVEGWKLK